MGTRRAAPLGILIAALALYVATACPWVLGGDVGEMATLYAKGGVAHPPGYPLYVLWLRAFAWLPAATPALGAARATAALGALGVLALWAACRAWGASRGGAAVAAAVYATASLPWSLSTEAEVFAMNAAIAAALVGLAGPDAPLRGVRRAVATGALVGFGLCDHHTIVLVAPAVVIALVRAWRESTWRRAAGGFAVALALALSPYLYTLWASHRAGGFVWGPPMDLAALARHVLRAEYWHPSDPRARLFAGEHLASLGRHLAKDLLYLPLAVAALGLAVRLVRARDAGAATAVLGSWLLAGPAFVVLVVASGGMGASITLPLGVNLAIVERFYLLPELLACVPIAWGVDALLERAPRASPIAFGLAGVAAIIGVVVSAPRVRARQGDWVERYATDLLEGAPPRAILIGSGDHRFFGVLYEQTARGVRDDVLYVDRALVSRPWYAARVERALGAPLGPDLAASALATGRPVLVANDDDDVAAFAGRPMVPLGLAMRLVPEAPPLEQVEADNVAVFDHLARAPSRPPDPWGWAGDADEAYERAWEWLARAYETRGDAAHARALRERATRRTP